MNRPAEKGKYWLWLLATAVALLSAAGGASLWHLVQKKPAPMLTMLTLPEPRALGDFELRDTAGERFTLENLQGKWTLVFFGFTHCPDVCPSTLYDLQQIHGKLKNEAHKNGRQHQVLFISVDPERDTPEHLKNYLAFFDNDFLGATGEAQQLQAITRKLGIAYRIEEHEAGDPQYTVDHSAAILLLDQQGRLHGIFTAPHDAETMVRDLAAVIY